MVDMWENGKKAGGTAFKGVKSAGQQNSNIDTEYAEYLKKKIRKKS